MNDAPKLLVEWSSPWHEFLTAIRPALGRSPKRLAGEAQVGLFPYRGILISWVCEIALLIAVIVLPAKLASMQPYEPPPKPKYDIIYYSGNELPRTEDVGGAQAGRSGRSGGREAHHPTQTIRVARGSTVRETVVDAPKLDLPKSNSAVANLLALKALPGPAPAEGMRSSARTPTLSQVAVAPAPRIEPDKMKAVPQLNVGVVPPSAAAPQREIAQLHLPGSQVMEVVAPPVSAPERMTNLNPRLTLPAPNVVAPPPIITREAPSMGPGFGAGDLQKQIVPPPVQVGDASAQRRAISGIGSASVVPPTVQLGAGSAQRSAVGGIGTGTAVVPPPPSVSGGGSLTGQGRGNRGAGFGGPLDAGLAAAPPSSNGGGSASGVVLSSQPGSKVGMPGSGGSGALAMSPSGGDKAGLGGSGGGSGIGRGDGPGSGFSGPGSGAGKEGSGPGSDPMARGGISPYPGPGGAGTGTSGTPAMPGVSVKGGNNVVTLPSFGSGGSQSAAVRSNTHPVNKGPDITIVATSRSGGAFNFYGALKGDKVYTIYIETSLGTAVMQFADPASAAHGYAEDLTAPQPMRADLPAGLPKARLVIGCVLDRSGLLRSPKVLEPASAVMTSKVLAALNGWKFRPALRGDQPIEVNAILGFNIDTNDVF